MKMLKRTLLISVLCFISLSLSADHFKVGMTVLADCHGFFAKGKIKRFFKDNTLVNQIFIKDSKQTVAQYVKTIGDITVTDFKRVSLV